MRKYAIVGMGAAGFAAAETIRQFDDRGEILIISPEDAGYYSRPALAYYLSKEINERSLFPRSPSDFKQLKIKTLKNLVIGIDPGKNEILLDNRNRIIYDKLLLAPGAKAVQPRLDGVDLEGVFYLDSHAQTKKMIRFAKKGRRAIVVGGGITALEIVEGLNARRMEVHFFLRGDLYWNRVLDGAESKIILSRLEDEGVIVHRNTEAARITAKGGKVASIETNHGEIMATDLAAFAIGVRPRTGLATGAGIEIQRGIKVNQFMETNLASVYAAGDAAEVYDPDTGTWVVDSLWHIARQQGVAAGMNMAGERQPYQRRRPINVTRLAGLTTTIIGSVGREAPEDECSIVRGESETWQLMPDAVICQDQFDVNRIRLMLGKDRILGAVLIGDQHLSQILEELITKKYDIRPVHDMLVQQAEPIGKILLDFWKTRK